MSTPTYQISSKQKSFDRGVLLFSKQHSILSRNHVSNIRLPKLTRWSYLVQTGRNLFCAVVQSLLYVSFHFCRTFEFHAFHPFHTHCRFRIPITVFSPFSVYDAKAGSHLIKASRSTNRINFNYSIQWHPNRKNETCPCYGSIFLAYGRCEDGSDSIVRRKGIKFGNNLQSLNEDNR